MQYLSVTFAAAFANNQEWIGIAGIVPEGQTGRYRFASNSSLAKVAVKEILKDVQVGSLSQLTITADELATMVEESMEGQK